MRLTMNHHTRRMFRAVIVGLTCWAAVAAQAGPHWGPGPRGGVYYHHHHRGAAWVAPALVGGVLLGAALAAPTYAAPLPPPVYPAYTVPYPSVTYSTPVPVQPVGYFCPTSGQFYPYVPTCSVPWQLL